MPEDENEEELHGEFGCTMGEDEHGLYFRAEYELVEDEDGDCRPVGASIHTHLHGVPAPAAAATLAMAAVKMLSDHMAHDIFESIGLHSLAHAMASAAAKQYLIHAIESLPDNTDDYSMAVPDDISELLKGE